MLSKLKFIFLYYLTWVLFFELLRVIFLLYYSGNTSELSFSTILGTLWYGLRMDLSISAYILAPVCFFVLLALIIPFFRKRVIYLIYTSIILFFVVLLTICDLGVYTIWGFRIDATPLTFLSTPREAFASISHLPLFWIGLGFIVFYVLCIFAFRYVIRKIFFDPQPRLRIVTALVVLVVMVALIIPIRGGLQLAPLNQSSVYFSSKNFANHAAINASWNFLHSVFSKDRSRKNPYQYATAERQKQVIDSLYNGSGPTPQLIKFSSDTPTNVIVVIWESFTEKALHVMPEDQEITPQFNRLKQEGIYFSNLYACGDRTNKGVPAILSGYPAMPNTTIIHSPGKSARLKVLSQVFKEKGYSTPFFYGGEPEFANILSYLTHGGFDPIVGKSDFSKKDMNSKWGAHDGVVMDRVVEDLNKTKQPFFATWLTLSSHEPFETPVPSIFEGDGTEKQFLNSLHYTDQVLGEFIDRCSQQPWWKNTVVIITGDHGHRLPETGNPADDFRSPMLWLGGALFQKGIVVDKIVSQMDIAAMLAKQAGIPNTYFPFSKNSLDPTVKSWAYFCFNNGFGFVDSAGTVVFDNVGKQPIEQQGRAGASEIEAGKVMQQFTYEDFIRK